MNIKEIANKLSEKGLRVTPQRIAILGAIIKLNNHPTAEKNYRIHQKKPSEYFSRNGV